MKRPLRIVAIVAAVGLAMFLVFVVMTWPPFTSMERELTGQSFELTTIAFFDGMSPGFRSEGDRIWVYRIPDEIANRLGEKDYPLEDYPMWCALVFDGYKRISWTLASGPLPDDVRQTVEFAVGDEPVGDVELADLSSMQDARRYARSLLSRPGTLIAGWHCQGNYFLYVMSLETRVLIKLSLLT